MKKSFKLFYAFSMAWQLGFLIVISFLGFLILGILLDKIFSKKPLFTILGTIVGIIICIYDTYYLILPLIKKEND